MPWLLIIGIWCLFSAPLVSAKTSEQSLNFGDFGKIALYGTETTNPQDLVIFISGDGGWKSGVIDMAKQLAREGALVIGVDIVRYQKSVALNKSSCTYAAADFENLSKFVQKKLKFKSYRRPLLVGYSSGATLVYALLAQAPNNTFRGGLSLGFCNDLTLAKPLCARNDLKWKVGKKPHIYLYEATDKLEDPWMVLNGQDDQVCLAGPTKEFVDATQGASIEFLPKVGHGFSVSSRWMPQYTSLYKKIVMPPPALPKDARIQDLPLIEELPEGASSEYFSILVTGDGGWAGIDRHIARDLSAHGVPVIGWNSLEYLWNEKSPETASRDLQRVIEHFTSRLNKAKVRLIGYSLGADILPFMVNRLTADVLKKIDRLVLLGPSLSTSFEFHVSDWIASDGEEERRVLPELQKIRSVPIYCVFGEEEESSLCREKGLAAHRIIAMKGGHHFAGNYSAISKIVMDPN